MPTPISEKQVKKNILVPEPRARFLRACYRLPVDTTPVWFMRQAGRYMPEYRAVREKYSLLEIVERPDIAAEVAMQPILAHNVDAAIIFADILLLLVPMGINLEFVPGVGPHIDNPVRSTEDVARLRMMDAKTDLGHIMEAIHLLRGELNDDIALIGFAGAPFTVASYMIEGAPSKNYLRVKNMMYSQPEDWHSLMNKVAEATSNYLLAQIVAGAQAVQIFDSWAGVLSPGDYEQFALPYSKQVLRAVEETGVPTLHFGTVTATLLKLMKHAGSTVIGLDWRVPLDEGWNILGDDVAVQGNLYPAALLAPLPVLREKAEDVLQRAAGRPGHIFNLGHGILQQTPVENVSALVEMVHEWTAKDAS